MPAFIATSEDLTIPVELDSYHQSLMEAKGFWNLYFNTKIE